MGMLPQEIVKNLNALILGQKWSHGSYVVCRVLCPVFACVSSPCMSQQTSNCHEKVEQQVHWVTYPAENPEIMSEGGASSLYDIHINIRASLCDLSL